MKILRNQQMGQSDLGWLRSRFHFSFAQYYNPDNMNFGVLRVLNDDLIEPGTGFDRHPHRDMEIISYVVEGSLTHQDNMGHKRTLERGMVQYMSAGTGVFHSEHNYGEVICRILQIWIPPTAKNLTPNYGDYNFDWSLREGKWLHMVSGQDGKAPVKIHQDANIYSLWLAADNTITTPIPNGRQGYLVQIEGTSSLTESYTDNDVSLYMGDAAELTSATDILALSDSHFLLIEMA